MMIRIRRAQAVLAVLALTFLCGASLAFAQTSGGAISDSARSQISALLRDKMSRTPAQKKIDSNLLYAARLAQGQPLAAGMPHLTLGVDPGVGGRVVVDIVGKVTDSLIDRLTQQGATIIDFTFGLRNVRAEVPLAKLETIASWSDVRFIHRKQRAATSGSMAGPKLAAVTPSVLANTKAGFAARAAVVRQNLQAALQAKGARPLAVTAVNVSEGFVTHKVDQEIAQFGVIGTGVKVGVLSDGVSSLSIVQASGDLPAVTVLPGQAGAGDEGTAMLEIVHDIAPGAKLYFATAFNSITSFAQNIQDLRAAGCDIIVDDVFYFTETPFQKGQSPSVASTTNGGIVIEAVNNVTASGALYFSSAGNEGNLDDGTTGAWTGDFVNGGPVGGPVGGIGETGNVHLFAPATTVDILTGTAPFGVFTLEWSDPLGASADDYDLFILDPTGVNVVAFSADTQDGTGDPFEGIDAGGAVPPGYQFVIVQFTGADRYLHLSTNRGTLSIGTDGETHGHSATPTQFAFTVAATPAAGAFGPGYPVGPFPGPFTGANLIEPFSSDGYRRVFYNADSTPITPGDVSSTGGQLFLKPDFTAADGVSCAAPGFNPFYGTSAAAPHAAAIAALVKSAAPSYTQAQIANALVSTAIDIMGPGVDRDSGAGILDALAAVQSTSVTPQAVLTVGDLTINDVGGNGNGGVEPGECGSLQVELINGNATINATAISGTLTSSTPGVEVDVATATWPDIAGGGSGVNSPRFRFSLSNTVACPLNVQFTLTVTFSGGASPQVLTFSVRTGTPPVVVPTSLNNVAPPAAPGIYTAITGIQNTRLGRTAVASACAAPKDDPGLLGGTGTRRFDAYSFTNCSGHTACVNVTLEQDNGNSLLAAMYKNSYDPANIETNYLGDAGGSTPFTSFSVSVDPGETFVVVVSDTIVADMNRPYRLTVDGICLPCTTFTGVGICCPTIPLLPATLPSGIAGSPYPTTVITPQNGANPFTFQVTGLPPGLTATSNGNSVTISGTPIMAFTGVVTISGTNKNGCPFSQDYPLTITCDPSSPSHVPMTVASAVCPGSAGNTASVPSAGAGATYVWNIINGTITGGAGTNAITFTAGAGVGPIELSVVATQPTGCALWSNATVNINPIPAAPTAGNNGPLSPGQTLNLTASTVPGGTYSWTGPANFTSTQQNPTIEDVTVANAGVYSVTVTVGGCTSAPGTTTVVVLDLTPASLTVDAPEPNFHTHTNGVLLAGNGVFELGETAVVTPGWTNPGPASVTFTGTLSGFTGPAGPTYTIVDGAADYGTVASAGTTDCADATSDCYSLEVTGARPVAHWDTTVLETLSTGATKTWTLHIGESFTDVPVSSPFYRFVETIFHKGITAGCAAGTFCLGTSVTRAQDAVFLLLAEHGSGYTPPPATGIFADVPVSSPFAPFIERLVAEGITAGCTAGNFCPGDPVTRAQSAVFLLRAEHGPAYTPPPAVGLFTDVPVSSPFAPWIEQLVAEGVTVGCGGGNFCPADAVSRGQNAVFLTTTFKLHLYQP